MKILITNDDGVFAEGLLKLACSLEKIAEIFIVAPDRQRSATGHAITMHEPIRASKIKLLDRDFEAWSVSGTPADCVKLGIEVLLKEPPDLVFSGINSGANLGTDVLYSGTVSAAIEGALLGFPSIAISLSGFSGLNYDYAAEFSLILAQKMIENKLPLDTLLNVNVPNCKKKEIQDVKITTLGVRKYKNSFIERIDPRGQAYYWLGGEIIDEDHQDGTDLYCIKNKMISITPIHFDLTKFNLIRDLESWNISLE